MRRGYRYRKGSLRSDKGAGKVDGGACEGGLRKEEGRGM